MTRRRAVEDPVSHERWLVSYADFITLLFAFFVVMYSISQVNEGKYKVLSETLTDAFSSTQIDTGKAQQDLTLDPFQVGEIAKSNPMSVIKLENPIIKQNEGDADATQEGVVEQQGGVVDSFEKLSKEIEQSLDVLTDSDMITVRGNEEWLEVEMNSSLLFDSGAATLNTNALELLGGIGELLKQGDNPVRVEGFTDNVPINSRLFPSNWELSTARAAAVVKLFVEEGLDPARFAAIGYGEFQPVDSNETDEGRAKNRRVVLMISKSGELRPELRQQTDVESLVAPAEEAAPDADGNTGIKILIPGVNVPEKSPTVEPAPAPTTPASGIQGVKTVELEDGGLLFTSDKPEPENPQ